MNQEAVPQGSNKTEPESRHETKLLRVIETNHQVAKIAVELEGLFSQREVGEQAIDEKLRELPEKVRERFKQAIHYYLIQKRDVHEYTQSFHKWIEHHESFGITIPETPEEWGKAVFRYLVGEEPKGIVRMQVKEIYLVMSFSDPRDYTAVRKRNEGKPLDTSVDKSAGSYHSNVYLFIHERRISQSKGDDKIPLPILMIREDLNEAWESTFIHERQHFINNKILYDFSDLEPSSKRDDKKEEYKVRRARWNIQRAQKDIKDEVLAYIRDGSTGVRLRDSLFGDLYKNLFLTLPEREREEARRIVGEVKEILESINIEDHKTARDLEFRALLVYQLAHVPFTELPKWMREIKNYYEAKFRLLQPFKDVYEISSGFVNRQGQPYLFGLLHMQHVPKKYEEIVQRVTNRGKQLWEEMKGVYKDAYRVAFSESRVHDAEEKLKLLMADYQSKYRELADLLSTLEGGHLFVPEASGSSVYYFGQPDHDTEELETETTEKVRKAILDLVADIPPEQALEIHNYLSGKTREKPRSYSVLAGKIKKTIHGFNGHRKSWVLLETNEDFEGSFIIVLDFWLPKDDKLKKAPQRFPYVGYVSQPPQGARMEITVHAKSPLKK